MHRVTGEARQLAATMARRVNQAIVFTPSYANHSVRPEQIRQQSWVQSDCIMKPRLRGELAWPNHRGVLFQIITRPITKAGLQPFLPLHVPFDPLALAANLRAARGRSPRWL